MRILLVHNRYRIRAGEDAVFDAERALLESRGHHVATYIEDNRGVADRSAPALAAGTVWSHRAHRRVSEEIAGFVPDIVHVHNTLPLISPAVYYAASRAGVPVVQTLHNYRIACPAAVLFRNGRVCEDCLGRGLKWPGIRYACYRDSRAASATVAAMLALHRLLGTWSTKVDSYIALTEFARERFIDEGLPAGRIFVKPNFVADPGRPDTAPAARHGGLFVGRLNQEKGVRTLLQAWREIGLPLRVLGEGPLRAELERINPPEVSIEGPCSAAGVAGAMRSAQFLVFPSEWYEPFGLVALEAFANRLPVIASRQGGIPEIVDDGTTGLLFAPGDVSDLAAKLRWAVDHADELRAMGDSARAAYERRYTPERNYDQLVTIYRTTIEQAQGADRRGRTTNGVSARPSPQAPPRRS